MPRDDRVYTDTDFTPRAEYIETVETWFGAGAESVPLRTDGAAAADAMNEWIDDRTEGLIRDLFTADSFNDNSRLVLLNALYMKAAWRETLDPEMTFRHPFTRLDGSVEDVEMMDATPTASAAAKGADYVAATLAYAGDTLEMVIVVPDAGAFSQPIGGWNVANVVSMEGMFTSALGVSMAFNQDLSTWCVTNIPTPPADFMHDGTFTPAFTPVWGTCP